MIDGNYSTSKSLRAFTDDFFKHSFGFDDLFSYVEKHFDKVEAFPPYNVVVIRNERQEAVEYHLELAVAGYRREHLNTQITRSKGKTILEITGSKDGEKDDGREYTHRGLASRSFRRQFAIADNVKVDGASFADGILTVKLVVVTPTLPVERIEIK